MNPRRQFIKQISLVALGALLVPAGSLLGQASQEVHTVQKGETLSSIAQRYGMSVIELRRLNNLTGDQIIVGQKLLVSQSPMTGTVSYTVQSGDTLSALASKFGVSVRNLQSANGLTSSRINVGQILIIPTAGSLNQSGGVNYITEVTKLSSSLRIPRGRWRYIVGHHSATERGNARSYDRYHREDRGMENGLAYHFVIGNGVDSGLGEVEIGPRWRRQLQGGHVRDHQVNLSGIGICLVGNFQQRAPHPEQIQAFTQLVRYLRNDLLSRDKVRFAVHKEIDLRHTVCPGKFFPLKEMHRLFPS